MGMDNMGAWKRNHIEKERKERDRFIGITTRKEKRKRRVTRMEGQGSDEERGESQKEWGEEEKGRT